MLLDYFIIETLNLNVITFPFMNANHSCAFYSQQAIIRAFNSLQLNLTSFYRSLLTTRDLIFIQTF
jgi:hypothetical protein